MTKKDWFMTLDTIIDDSNLEDKTEAHDFIASEINKLETKASRAKEHAAEKRAAGDPLKEMTFAVLTDEYQTTDEITDHVIETYPLDTEDVTKSKIVSRLSQIVRDGMAEKTLTKQGSRRVTAYRLSITSPNEGMEE